MLKIRSLIIELFTGFCGFSNCQFALTYVGETLFPIGENAELECMFDPTCKFCLFFIDQFLCQLQTKKVISVCAL